MVVKAKFIGSDGSLGYIKGKVYWFVFGANKVITIVPIGETNAKTCQYESLKSMLNNWEILENEK